MAATAGTFKNSRARFRLGVWRGGFANLGSKWPWALLTLAAGSFGPLVYLLRPRR
jgi:hypothetical protein